MKIESASLLSIGVIDTARNRGFQSQNDVSAAKGPGRTKTNYRQRHLTIVRNVTATGFSSKPQNTRMLDSMGENLSFDLTLIQARFKVKTDWQLIGQSLAMVAKADHHPHSRKEKNKTSQPTYVVGGLFRTVGGKPVSVPANQFGFPARFEQPCDRPEI